MENTWLALLPEKHMGGSCWAHLIKLCDKMCALSCLGKDLWQWTGGPSPGCNLPLSQMMSGGLNAVHST